MKLAGILILSVLAFTRVIGLPVAHAEVSVDGLAEENETWLDREAVAYFISTLPVSNPALIQAITAEVIGARLVRDELGLTIAIYFRDEVWLQTASKADSAPGHVYRIEVPKTLRLRIEAREGLVRVIALNPGSEGLRVMAKIPLLPDLVYVHELDANLSSGVLKFKAGVAGNWLTAVAVSTLVSPTKGSVDLWGSVLETLPILKWSAAHEKGQAPGILKLPGPELPAVSGWKFNENKIAP